MKTKLALFLLLVMTASLAGCAARGGASSQPSQSPAAESGASAEQSSAPEAAPQPDEESAGEPAASLAEVALTVPKISSNQEGLVEKVAFQLTLPEGMTVEYNNNIPYVMDGDTEYLRTSSMSSGITEEIILSRQAEAGIPAEKVELNAYNTILVIQPVAYPTDGFEYTYYILFDDDSVLPLTFFSQTESDAAKQEFSGVVASFALA